MSKENNIGAPVDWKKGMTIVWAILLVSASGFLAMGGFIVAIVSNTVLDFIALVILPAVAALMGMLAILFSLSRKNLIDSARLLCWISTGMLVITTSRLIWNIGF